MSLVLAVVVDVTVALAFALGATALLRRAPAAVRHAILAAGLVAAALAPALEVVVPPWHLPVAWSTADVTTSGLTLTSSPAPEAVEVTPVPVAGSGLPWLPLVLAVWGGGALVVFAGLLTGLVRLARATRRFPVVAAGPWRERTDARAAEERLSRPVTLLQSADTSLLLTFGLIRPRIVLPSGAAGWPAERCDIVLAHELAHIRRRDWLLQLIAEGIRAMYWFHPLAWTAVRRLRDESEFACDDAVLAGGVAATDYASHLLDVARHAVRPRPAWASAPAVANPSTLERRIAAMLTDQRKRLPVSRRAGWLAAAAVLAAAVPLAAVTLDEPSAQLPARLAAPAPDVARVPTSAPDASSPATRAEAAAPGPAVPAPLAEPEPGPVAAAPVQQDPATLLGVIQDQTGAVLPGVEVQLTDTAFGVVFSQVTDGAGRFRFPELQPGRYELVTQLPGFANVTNVMTLAAGSNVERRLTLPLGSVQETITVTCSATPGARLADHSVFAMPARPAAGEPLVPPALLQRFWNRAAAAQAPEGAGTEIRPVRVGGQILAPRLGSKVNPVCPGTVLPVVDTVVILSGRIGVDGFLNDLRTVRADAALPVEFVDSALDAIRQWHYIPTRLNNQPVDVNVTFTVVFRRM
jgi:beta-lactamase regulating signal transducer with metallopeptidase domain